MMLYYLDSSAWVKRYFKTAGLRSIQRDAIGDPPQNSQRAAMRQIAAHDCCPVEPTRPHDALWLTLAIRIRCKSGESQMTHKRDSASICVWISLPFLRIIFSFAAKSVFNWPKDVEHFLLHDLLPANRVAR
jgi:hypothetical protein